MLHCTSVTSVTPVMVITSVTSRWYTMGRYGAATPRYVLDNKDTCREGRNEKQVRRPSVSRLGRISSPTRISRQTRFLGNSGFLQNSRICWILRPLDVWCRYVLTVAPVFASKEWGRGALYKSCRKFWTICCRFDWYDIIRISIS